MMHTNTLIILLLAIFVHGCADLRSAKQQYQQNEYDKAEAQWLSLADKGFPEAYAELSRLYLEGRVSSGINLEKALHYYELAHLSGYSKNYRQLTRLINAPNTPNEFRNKLIEQLEEFVQQGNQDAMLLFAQLQLDGVYYEKNVDAALTTFNTLLQKGNGPAAFALAEVFRIGVDVEQNLQESFRLQTIAYQLGEVRAGFQLATSYEFGLGTKVNLAKSEDLLRALASDDDIAASYKLAAFLQRNSEQIPDEAITRYRRAAQSGYGLAKLRMADLYLHGTGVDKLPEKAIKMYLELSGAGVGGASAKLGDIYRDGEHRTLDYARANQLYNLAYDQGFDNAQLRLAKMLANGYGVTRDLEAAKSIYLHFARQGVASSAYEYARLLELQDDSAILAPETLKWYQVSANGQHIPAQLKIVRALLIGNGLALNIEKALSLLEQLEKRASPEAMMLFGDLYKSGRLVELNRRLSESYYLNALEHGFQPAIFKLGELYSDPSSELYNLGKAKAVYQSINLQGRLDESFKLARLYEGYLGKNAVNRDLVSWYVSAAKKRLHSSKTTN